MKVLWKLSKEAARYKKLYMLAIASTLLLTVVNLAAPRVLSSMVAVVEGVMAEDSLQTILKLTLLLVGLYLLRILFRYLSNYIAHRAAWLLVGDMRIKMYDKLQSFDMHFFQDKQSGDLMSRVINDTRDFELLYAHIIPEVITNFATFAGVLVILLSINAKLALITCFPIPLILFASTYFAGKVRPYFRANQRSIGALNAKLQDNLSGMHEIQSFVQEKREADAVGKKVWEQVRAMLRALKASAIFHPSVEFLSSVGTILVVGVGGVMAFRGKISVSDIVAFLLYLSLFYTPISGAATLLENMQQSLAGAERAMLILETPSGIADAKDAVELENVKGGIEFQHVSFSYEDDVPVLDDISFACQPGQMIALVGPTGVGKTTMTELVSRFYDPTQGKILIDGQDIAHVTLKSLRRNIAPVLQDTFLFNGTIAENISYSDPKAEREKIVEAAKAAHIHEDILQMPGQYDTQVGERGLRLSGGQKQRIAIARAILSGAPIIILDEATASVDVETESSIQSAIQEIAGTKTIIAIAHRLSTIRNADRILVIQDGRIAEEGTHEELIKNDGYYSRLNRIKT